MFVENTINQCYVDKIHNVDLLMDHLSTFLEERHPFWIIINLSYSEYDNIYTKTHPIKQGQTLGLCPTPIFYT